jgi:hypothetical protein
LADDRLSHHGCAYRSCGSRSVLEATNFLSSGKTGHCDFQTQPLGSETGQYPNFCENILRT